VGYNDRMPKQITIIGAGPSGMTAALFAARTGANVCLVDANASVGRKLLATGAGRANLTNQHINPSRYTCSDPNWAPALLNKFGHSDLVTFFETIGILTYATPDGWCYPLSESAQTVVDAFENALHIAGVELIIGTRISAIRKSGGGFGLFAGEHELLHTERLIVAAGGKAFPTLGSRGDLIPSLQSIGHTVIPLTPALAPVLADMKAYRQLQGVRLDAHVRLVDKGALLAETTGNLIFTDWGLNGPAVMDLSHLISSRPGSKLVLHLNPLFESESKLRALIKSQQKTPTPLRVLLAAVMPPKLPPVLLQLSGLPADVPVNKLSHEQLSGLLKLTTAIPFKVTGVRGFEYCQVTAGGVPVSEVEPETMRSRILPNLYLVGETLDVVGPCGGYNLQFAFSSGALAGMGVS
jgi:predicted Rossmann fold flavoprotein